MPNLHGTMREADRTQHGRSAEARQTSINAGQRIPHCSDWAAVIASTKRAAFSTRVIQRTRGAAEQGFSATGRARGRGAAWRAQGREWQVA